MKCISCGANIEPNDNQRQLKCNYCGSYSPNNLFLNFSLKRVELQNASINLKELLEHEKYSVVKEKALECINGNPNDSVLYIYLAISEFWLGTNDFKHIETVFKHFSKSSEISKNNEITNYITSYANSTISLAGNNKHYGEELSNSLEAFKFIDSLVVELSDDVKEQRVKFCEKSLTRFIETINDGINRYKDKFDVTYNNIRDFYLSLKYSDKLEYYEKFYLFINFLMPKYKRKSYFKELNKYITDTHKYLDQHKSKFTGKKITFNIFGKLKIK